MNGEGEAAVSPTASEAAKQGQHHSAGSAAAGFGSSTNLHQPTAPNAPTGSLGGVAHAAGSLKSSRVTTPAAYNSGSRAATAPGLTGATRGGLERDESVKSDQSYFSIASADMQDFLAEFRGARNDFLGPQCEWMSRLDLAEIVDRVNLPLPDVRLIADLFDEMAAVSTTFDKDSTTKKVPFEAFLARMNFRIQGRYPLETVRAVFFAHSNGSSESINSDAPHKAGGAVVVSPHSPPLTTSAAPPRQVLVTGPKTFSVSAAAEAATSSTAAPLVQRSTVGMPRGRVLEDALWRGLGLRVSSADVSRWMHHIGVPNDDSYPLQLTDFAALVSVASGQKLDDDMTSSASQPQAILGYTLSANPTPTLAVS